eukprot:363348-Chlamydomonas_euryale.AAC.18
MVCAWPDAPGAFHGCSRHMDARYCLWYVYCLRGARVRVVPTCIKTRTTQPMPWGILGFMGGPCLLGLGPWYLNCYHMHACMQSVCCRRVYNGSCVLAHMLAHCCRRVYNGSCVLAHMLAHEHSSACGSPCRDVCTETGAVGTNSDPTSAPSMLRLGSPAPVQSAPYLASLTPECLASVLLKQARARVARRASDTLHT